MSEASLESLRDIHLPPAPALATILPPDPLPWAAGALLLILAAGWGIRRHFRRRPLRAALAAVAALESEWRRHGDAVRLAAGLAQILRHHALARYPEAGIAGLTGAGWLGFLDARGGNGEFSAGPGSALEELPYRRRGEADGQALIDLVRRWLKANSP